MNDPNLKPLRRWTPAVELQAQLDRFLLASGPRSRSLRDIAHLSALRYEFDRAFPSPARLLAFHQECVAVDDRPWPLVTRMAAALHQTGRLDGVAEFFSGASHSLDRDIAQALAQHVSGLPRWTHGAGVEYVLQQRTPEGLWTSIPFWAEQTRHAEQSVIAGYLQGQARWAAAIGNGMEPTFVFGLDAEGKPLRAQDVLRQELSQVCTYELPSGSLQPLQPTHALHTTPPESTWSTEPEQARRPRCAA
jgi:hypothetical protein